ncbi:hypothetical protein CC85DRAFT_284520 [Cutaneotrichosporon oleaginosum]|uniref:Uncharacterized protein n=1 Tax=Cutaneotrichosporon oleaginosum TaxID=879819 RepID=A0A0J0XQJ6_9TREE|nr:uncharacterized protein CC85DRAFT_284520 [Cutaneotrichosporon oleaginosum]KLT43373.1 hypothetical protein CC85DRAFT_284520 [Cutaneotrichosporon oleaginosum]TXT05412.1 hypothetical protein COLE_06732 [Cutaneotrichosporon oleaginosum]
MFINSAGAVLRGERATLEPRVVGASQDESNNNKWAQSPGAIAGFTIVFSLVAAACVYLLYRGPNRKAFPCIKRKKAPPAPKDVEGDVFPDEFGARGPAHWRETIVRKEAFFPVPKGAPVPADGNEKDYALRPQRTASLYSYDSKYTTATTINGAPRSNRNSRTSLQDHRSSRVSASRRPPSLGAASALSIPELPEAAYLATQDPLFGLPAQAPHSAPLQRSPGTGAAQQSDYFGPASPGLLSANSAYGRSPATTPPAAAAANRRSLVRKSVGSAVGIPSPLAQSTISHETGKPQRPDLRKSRTVSFAEKPDSRRQSTSTPSPPRTQSRTSTRSAPSGSLPPGAGEPLEPLPPLPQFLRASGVDEAIPMSVPRVSWNGPGFSPESGPSKHADNFPPLPEGAYPPTHPVALAHAKLSSASASPPSPSPSTFSPVQFSTPPQSPTTKRAPTAPGYVSRFSRSPPTPTHNGYAPEVLSREAYSENLSSSGSRSGSASPSSPPASTPPTSVSHYSTPASSIAGHGARVVSGKRPDKAGHRKGGSSSSSPSSPSSPTSSTSSRKRGLWYDSEVTGLGISSPIPAGAKPPTVAPPARV